MHARFWCIHAFLRVAGTDRAMVPRERSLGKQKSTPHAVPVGLCRVHGAATAQPIPIVHRASKYGQRVHEATSMVTCIDTARVSTVRCLKSVSAARSRSSLRVQPAAAHIREHAPYRKTRNRTSCDNLANAPHNVRRTRGRIHRPSKQSTSRRIQQCQNL